jgi:squalene-associated FAD-dependent desaturase
MSGNSIPRVAIIGGGLAGMAAAAALVERGVRAEIFEARRQIGGRAASFEDTETGERVDYCQHVSMGCCTQLAHFCHTTGVEGLFRDDEKLHFFARDGKRSDFRATFGLPAPLHLLPGLLRLDFLTFTERIQAGRLLMRLALWERDAEQTEPTIAEWLCAEGASTPVTQRFFATVLVSALGETLERASTSAARQVFVDGFMRSSAAWKLRVPRVPLTEIFDFRAGGWLANQGVVVHRSAPIKQLVATDGRVTGLLQSDGVEQPFDACVVAVPWRKLAALLPETIRTSWPESALPEELESSPITGVHLWFDRPVTALPHAVLVDRLSQWMFNRGAEAQGTASPARHYVQVVISASRELARRDKSEVVREVIDDLEAVFPEARGAQLLESRVITEPNAVFSVRPGCDAHRLAQSTPIPGLFLAGDWTATGWPATMEGAVRSGNLAADAVLRSFGLAGVKLAAELPTGWFARMFLPRENHVRKIG